MSRHIFLKRLALIGAALSIAFGAGAAPALADTKSDTLSVLKKFAVLGTWALDCTKSPSPENGYIYYYLDEKLGPMSVADRGRGRELYSPVISAMELAPDRIEMTRSATGPDGTVAVTVAELLVTSRDSLRPLRAVTTVGSRVFSTVENGRSTKTGDLTPDVWRCAGASGS